MNVVNTLHFLCFIQLTGVGSHDEWTTTFRENIVQTWQQPEHYDFIYSLPSPGHARFTTTRKPTLVTMTAMVGQCWDERNRMACMPNKDSGNKWNRLLRDGKDRRPLADENSSFEGLDLLA